MPHTPQTQQVMFHVSCHQIPVNIPRDKDLRENAHCPDFCFICCCAVWVFFLRIALVSAMLLMLLLLPPAAAFCRCLLRRLCRGSIAASALSLQRLLRHCSFGYCLLCLCSFLGFFFAWRFSSLAPYIHQPTRQHTAARKRCSRRRHTQRYARQTAAHEHHWRTHIRNNTSPRANAHSNN